MSNEIQKKPQEYILVTSCKDEGENLPNLIQSVVEQTFRPVLWVIVDDGSTDNTPEIIREAKGKNGWIQSIRFNEGRRRDIGLHLAKVINKGFNFATEYCMKNGISYEYLGNLDADLILNHTFFENLIKEFEKNPKLGVASGGTKHIIRDRIKYAKVRTDEPSGGHMLIRRECFEEIGGFPLSYASDSVLKARARLRGWETKRFEANLATEVRDVSSAEGYWKGYIKTGKSYYYLNFNPIHVLIKGIIHLSKKPYYTGIAYLIGYFGNFILRKEQIDDEEIKGYYWNKWKEVIRKRLSCRGNEK